MIETLEGIGTLIQEVPPQRWPVKYRFQISTQIVSRTGLPPAVRKSYNVGIVEALSGEVLPRGVFQLQAEDGEILKVKNLEVGWTLLSQG